MSNTPWHDDPKTMRTEGHNPVEVDKCILETVNDTSRGISISARSKERHLEAERSFKKAYNLAFMRHSGPQTEKKIAASLDDKVLELEIERDAADVAYTYSKDMNDLFGKKLDALRSLGANLREAYRNAGRGEW